MKLEKIITCTDAQHRLRFLLMERSLRAVGCDLPIWVIPFNEEVFELPKNSQYWVVPEIVDWINESDISTRKRKYQCLTTNNYQYVDTDIFFLSNPQSVLEPHSGLVACCNEWTNVDQLPNCVLTEESHAIMQRKSTMFHQYTFCAGQFACDEALFTPEALIATASKPEHRATCMNPPLGDQPGTNLLVFLSGVKVTNLTLPPYYMESSWIGDYPDDTSEYWHPPHRKPYLMHYYGFAHLMHLKRPVMKTFYDLLTVDEQQQFMEQSQKWNVVRAQWDNERRGITNKGVDE